MMIKRSLLIRILSICIVAFIVLLYYRKGFLEHTKVVDSITYRLQFNEEISQSNINKDSLQQQREQIQIASKDKKFGEFKYKMESNPVDLSTFVHFDLKGMPPLVQYYEQIFPLLKQFGVHGVLMEYEDMFPYEGKLKPIANLNSYTKDEIKTILELAKFNNIEIIPLIQTFGHLEFVLKLEQYEDLREVDRIPQSICPSNNASFEIIKEMINQVMTLHPDATNIHIGCDEVYYIGQCPLCLDRMFKYKLNTDQLWTEHVKKVASYVKNTYNIKPLIWDDHLRSINESYIANTGLHSLVQIVVWQYGSTIRIDSQTWSKYSSLFPNSLWAASAFKEANAPNSVVVNESLYLANHYAWVRTMAEQSRSIKFQNFVLTGWQRYDHFGSLCELFPAAIPSLISCLTLLKNQMYWDPSTEYALLGNVASQLDCGPKLDYCKFPGATILQLVRSFEAKKDAFTELKATNEYKGWTNEANLKLKFFSPGLIDKLYYQIRAIQDDNLHMQQQFQTSLSEVYPDWCVEEWIATVYKPFQNEVETIYNLLNNAIQTKTFPVRPLQYPKIQEEDKINEL